MLRSIHLIENGLQFWEDMCHMAELMTLTALKAKKYTSRRAPIRLAGPFRHWREFRASLQDKDAEFDAQRFYGYGQDNQSGPTEYQNTLGPLRLLPAQLHRWVGADRFTFHVTHTLRTKLDHISLRDVRWEIADRFYPSFAVVFDEPLIDRRRKKYSTMLVTRLEQKMIETGMDLASIRFQFFEDEFALHRRLETFYSGNLNNVVGNEPRLMRLVQEFIQHPPVTMGERFSIYPLEGGMFVERYTAAQLEAQGISLMGRDPGEIEWDHSPCWDTAIRYAVRLMLLLHQSPPSELRGLTESERFPGDAITNNAQLLVY